MPKVEDNHDNVVVVANISVANGFQITLFQYAILCAGLLPPEGHPNGSG